MRLRAVADARLRGFARSVLIPWSHWLSRILRCGCRCCSDRRTAAFSGLVAQRGLYTRRVQAHLFAPSPINTHHIIMLVNPLGPCKELYILFPVVASDAASVCRVIY